MAQTSNKPLQTWETSVRRIVAAGDLCPFFQAYLPVLIPTGYTMSPFPNALQSLRFRYSSSLQNARVSTSDGPRGGMFQAYTSRVLRSVQTQRHKKRTFDAAEGFFWWAGKGIDR